MTKNARPRSSCIAYRKYSPFDKLYSNVEELINVEITIDELVKISSNGKLHEELLRSQLNLFEGKGLR